MNLLATSLHQAAGTRVRLFPELFAGYAEPEIAFLSPDAGSVRPGPADRQMYVANAVDKRVPYAPPDYMPPYGGGEFTPACPDHGGHFDHIPVDAPQFRAAHLYGAARHTLDIWEHYLRHKVQWWHAPEIPQLELVPVVEWANAHSGPGFLETGAILNEQRQEHLFCLNFDVVAHEVGHAVLFATVGVPTPERMTAAYLAFHESFADLFGVIGVLRFASVITRLLAQTGGNLHALNMVNRLGRYSDNQQVRVASNATTMADVAGIRLRPDGGWDDDSGRNRNQHALGEPLTGAIFDMLVEIFQNGLAARDVLDDTMDTRGRDPRHVMRALTPLHRRFAGSLRRTPEAYEDALLEARDVVGFGMAHAMHRLHPEALSFGRAAACLLEAAERLGERSGRAAFLRLFLDRGIDPRPFLRDERGAIRFTEPNRDTMGLCRDKAAFLYANGMVRSGHRHHSH